MVYPLTDINTRSGKTEYFINKNEDGLLQLFKRNNFLDPGKGFSGEYVSCNTLLFSTVDDKFEGRVKKITPGLDNSVYHNWDDENANFTENTDPRKYAESVKAKLDTIQKNKSEEFFKRYLSDTAYHFAGLANMADKLGNHEEAELYREQISTICQKDPDKIDEIITYRLGEHGGYRTNKNEMLSHGKVLR